MDKKALLKPLVCLLVAFTASMLLFYFLYRADNKYTRETPQPIAGLLVLDKTALEEHPLQFPFQQWQYYPGLLLSPEDFAGDEAAIYRRYVFIGQYSGFNSGNPNLPRQGQGSYRLNISVPSNEREYALELPEVFSACRLYINGRLMLELGHSETEGYRPEIHNRVVTFLAKNNIEILLSVSNYSHYTSGLTYPPAFGDPLAVQSARDARLMIRAAACLLALFVAVFALWAGLKLRWSSGALFALLCLSFIGAVGYPLLHSFFVTSVQPWYSIEIFCHYAMFSLAAALHNRLCGIRGRVHYAVVVPLVFFCLLALGYGSGASLADNTFVRVFSILSVMFKLLTAAWLLVSSAWAVYKQSVKAAPMLTATTVYAASLFADRLWPLYEPVYGGWFGEIGAAILVVALTAMLWSDFVEAYRLRAVFSEERRYLTRQLELQRSHYQRLVGQIEETRFLMHDLRHHVRTLRAFARDGAIEDIQDYLEEIHPKVSGGEPLSYAAHSSVNAVLQHFASWAKKLGAALEIDLDVPTEIPFSGDELCILLGNLLENAVEALERQRKGGKYLYLKGRFADGRLALVVENSFDGQIRQRGERFYSHKRDGFGIGIESVRSIVQRHGGMCDFEVRGEVFHVSVLTPVGESEVTSTESLNAASAV